MELLRVLARLKTGASLKQARASLEVIAQHLASQYPDTANRDQDLRLPASAREIGLPSDSRIRILAITPAREPQRLRPTAALDSADLREPMP